MTGPLRAGRPHAYTARVMRTRRLLAALAGAAALGAAAPAALSAQEAVGVGSHLACVAPGDAAGIDALLTAAGSPLAGEGETFVREGRAAGLDPRFLVAIAAHETLLQTYGPADAIRNAFGLGPGWVFASERDAIARAARTLAAYYLAEGRVTVGAIGAKWAPIGAANDPTGLNRHWEAGVGTYYAALGGDPSLPVLADAQEGLPGCTAEPASAADAAQEGPPVVTAWGGTPPRGAAGGMAEGGDPRTGGPATLQGFVFPLALPVGAPASYGDAFLDPGPVACAGARRQCALTIASAPGRHVVAAVAGTLRIASPSEREEGIGFWIETGDGDRVGYGPLAEYAPGIAQGVAVTPGRPLGLGGGGLRFAWERDGYRVNPHPLLEATRPSA